MKLILLIQLNWMYIFYLIFLFIFQDIINNNKQMLW